MSAQLSIADIVAVLRAKDELSPAVKAASQLSVQEIGKLQTAVQAANREVADLKKTYASLSPQAAGSSFAQQLESEIGAATVKAQNLSTQLNDVKVTIRDALRPPDEASTLEQYFVRAGESIGKWAGGLVAFTAIVGGLAEGVSILKNEAATSIKAWADQEQASAKLTAALRSQGLAVPSVIDGYDKLATKYQQTTIYADEQITAMQALLVQIGGVMPAAMDRALKASTDLAAGLGTDLETATRLVAKAAAGHIETLGRYGITVNQAEFATRGFDAVLDVVEQRFGGAAQAQIDTYSGRLHQMANAWNNVEEAIGKFVVDNPIVITLFEKIAEALDHADTAANGSGIPKLLADLAHYIPMIDNGTLAILDNWGALSQREGWMSAAVDALPAIDSYTKEWLKSLLETEETLSGVDRLLKSIEQQPTPFEKMQKQMAAPDTASNWKGLISDGDKLQMVMSDITVAQTQLTDGEKKAAEAAFQHGLSVSETIQALREYYPDIDKAKLSLERLQEQTKENAKAAKEHAAELKRAAKEAEQAAEQASRALDQHYAAQERDRLAAEKAVAQGLKGQNVLMDLAIAMDDVQLHGKPFAQQLGVIGDQSGNAAKHMDELREKTVTLKSSLKEIFTGDFGSGFKDLFGSITKSLNPADIFSSMIGNGLSGLVSSGISLVGKGLSALFHLGGPSQQEVQGRDVEAQFEQAMGGWQGIQKALLDTGLSADQTNAKIQALWAAEKQGGSAVQKVIDDINSTIKKHADDVSGGIDQILAAAQGVGSGFPSALRPALEKLLEMNGLTADQKKSLQGLVDAAGPDFGQLEQLASSYGISLEQLGPKFQQTHIDTTAFKYYDAFKQLTDAGADVDGVLQGMAPKINDLIHDAEHFGSAVPEAMKPMLQKLVDMGLLTDDSGKKLTDLSGFNFDDNQSPLDTAVDKLTKAIDHLGDILGGLPSAAQTAADGIGDALGNVHIPEIHVPIVYDKSDAIPMAAGGDFIVDKPTLFLAGEAGRERATFSGANKADASSSADEKTHALLTKIANKLAFVDSLPNDIGRAIRTNLQFAQ